jgi:hypothetical protein
MAATGHFPTLLMHAAFLGLTGHQVGQSRESLAANGITDAHTSAQDFPTQGVVIALSAAWQLAEVGRVREAAAILRSLGPAVGWEPAPHGSMFVFAIGIDLCVRLDAGDDVAALIERLGANRGHHVVNGSRALAYFGPVELWLGIAAGHLGLFDDAVVDLEHAVKACSVNGAAGFRVEAQYELARVLARRAGPGDPERARALAGEAVRQADALGMPPLEAQAQRLVGDLDARTRG